MSTITQTPTATQQKDPIAMHEGDSYVSESGHKYLLVSPMGQANVWTAVDENQNVCVIKQPAPTDTRTGWPDFQNEMIMHELFKKSTHIRRQIDRVMPRTHEEPPRIVLEIMGHTLWSARQKRPFSTSEIHIIMKKALLGLRDVHKAGLVYADLKMQNILIDGLDVLSDGNDSSFDSLNVKLGDLGIVMYPMDFVKVQPIAYRAPEVYFKKHLSTAADIWSWGLIYCHLLQAQKDFKPMGMYDGLMKGSMSESEFAVSAQMCNDFDLGILDYYYDCYLPIRDVTHAPGKMWRDLAAEGLPQGEIDFLKWVLDADPRYRPSAESILDHGWLDGVNAPVPSPIAPQKENKQVETQAQAPTQAPTPPQDTPMTEAPKQEPATRPAPAKRSGTYLSYSKNSIAQAIWSVKSFVSDAKEGMLHATPTAVDPEGATPYAEIPTPSEDRLWLPSNERYKEQPQSNSDASGNLTVPPSNAAAVTGGPAPGATLGALQENGCSSTNGAERPGTPSMKRLHSGTPEAQAQQQPQFNRQQSSEPSRPKVPRGGTYLKYN